MVKLLLILLISGALADSFAADKQPPLLIDSSPAPVSTDAH